MYTLDTKHRAEWNNSPSAQKEPCQESLLNLSQLIYWQARALSSVNEATRNGKEKARDGALTWEVALPLEVPEVRGICLIILAHTLQQE